MKKSIGSKIISLLMVLTLMFGIAGISAFADDTGSEDSTSSSDESSASDDDASDADASPSPSASPSAAPSATPAAINVPKASESFYVYDEADKISAATEAAIIEKCTELYDSYGVKIVVMAINPLTDTSISDYGKAVFKEWKIGGDSDAGVLLVMEIVGNEDDDYYATAGSGLSKAFPSDSLKEDFLKKYLEPDFAVQNYDAGAKKFFDAAVAKIEDYAATQPNLKKPEKSGEGNVLTGVGIFLLILVLAIAAFMVIVYVHGQMVRKKRRAQRAARRRVSSREPDNESDSRLPDNLTGNSSGSKYDFDEFKPRDK